VLFILVLIFFLMVFLKNSVLGEFQAHAHRGWVIKESLKNLELPKWDKYWLLGNPIYRFYPWLSHLFSAVFMFMLNYEMAFRIAVFLSFMFSGISMYFVALKISRRRIVAVLSGLIFSLSGFSLSHLTIYSGTYPMIFSNILFPIAFYYFISCRDKREIAISSLSSAAIILSHHISGYLAFLLLGWFFIFSTVFDSVSKKRIVLNTNRIITILLALALSAVFTIPAFSGFSSASRFFQTGEEDIAKLMAKEGFSLQRQFLVFFNPVAIILSLGCFATKKAKPSFMVVTLLLIMYVGSGGLASLVAKIPMIRFIENSWRFLYIGNLLIPVAFAYSVGFIGRKTRKWVPYILSIPVIIFLIYSATRDVSIIQTFAYSLSEESRLALHNISYEQGFFRVMEFPPTIVNTEQTAMIAYHEKPIVAGKWLLPIYGQQHMFYDIVRNSSFFKTLENAAYFFELTGVRFIQVSKVSLLFSWGLPWTETITTVGSIMTGEHVIETRDMFFFEVNNTPKRAFLTSQKIGIRGEEDCVSQLIVDSIKAREPFFKKAVLVSDESGQFHCSQKEEIWTHLENLDEMDVEIKDYKSGMNYMEFGTASSEGGFLFVNEAWDQDWKVYVDGKETEFFKAWPGFLAFPVGAGKHDIKIKMSLTFLEIISGFVTIAALAVSLIFIFQRKI